MLLVSNFLVRGDYSVLIMAGLPSSWSLSESLEASDPSRSIVPAVGRLCQVPFGLVRINLVHL